MDDKARGPRNEIVLECEIDQWCNRYLVAAVKDLILSILPHTLKSNWQTLKIIYLYFLFRSPLLLKEENIVIGNASLGTAHMGAGSLD